VGGVLACRVVKHLDVIEHILPCCSTCQICPPPDPFPFQKLEEAFCRGIIMAIPTSIARQAIALQSAERGGQLAISIDLAAVSPRLMDQFRLARIFKGTLT
jgi:hypothetical protein